MSQRALSSRRASTRARTGSLLGACLTFFLLAPAAARADLVVIQESNGFPGAGDSETARQKVFIASDKLRVLDEAHGWALLVRLDQKVVREASSVERTYVEKPLSFYQKIRADREATRAAKIREFEQQLRSARTDSDRTELRNALQRMGLREDGKTLARLETFPEDERQVPIVVNGVAKTFKLLHYIVRENEGPPIFDTWVAPGLGRPDNVFKFYREIGTFSEPVVAKVMELDGFPIEITATIDDGNNKKTLHSRVFEVRDESIAPVEYEVPAGWKQVEGREAASLGASSDRTYACEVCGKKLVPGDGSGAVLWRDPWARAPHPVCSDACRRVVIQKTAEAQRKAEPVGPVAPDGQKPK